MVYAMREMIQRYGLFVSLGVFALVLSACAPKAEEQTSSPTPEPSANTEVKSEAKSGSPKGGVPEVDDPEGKKGRIVFVQAGCNACHMNPAVGKDYPDLRGLYGSKVKLQDGTEVVADEAYLKESIVNPNKKVVAGYQPNMTPYNYLSKEQVNQLIAYIRAMKDMKPEFVKEEVKTQ